MPKRKLNWFRSKFQLWQQQQLPISELYTLADKKTIYTIKYLYMKRALLVPYNKKQNKTM